MNVNGVTSQSVSNYSSASKTKESAAKKETTAAENTSAATGSGVVYEPSNENPKVTAAKKYTPNTELVNKFVHLQNCNSLKPFAYSFSEADASTSLEIQS